MALFRYNRGDSTYEVFPVRTRYGKETHYGAYSTTLCGRWLRVSAHRMRVAAPVTCEVCIKLAAERDLVKVEE